LVGTDNIDTYVFTGSSLHDELSMLVEAGLTPHHALYAATMRAAEFSGVDHSYGSVEEGKRADLVLLDRNPLINIKNSSAIRSVFYAGMHLDHNSLRELNSFAKDMAQSFRVNLRLLISMIRSPLMRVQFAD
jgi:adenine deaminase